MFETFFPNQQQKAEIESEKRQIGLAREQTAVSASTAEHQAYVEEQDRKADLLRWQQELDIEVLKHKLRNEYWNEAEGEWKRKTTVGKDGQRVELDPLMTEDGIAAVETVISGFIGENAKNLINSNFEERRILTMLKRTALDLNHIFKFNYDAYFVDPTPSNMTLVKRIIKNEIISSPYRALKGWTKKQDNMATKRVETYTESPQAERKKLFGVI